MMEDSKTHLKKFTNNIIKSCMRRKKSGINIDLLMIWLPIW